MVYVDSTVVMWKKNFERLTLLSHNAMNSNELFKAAKWTSRQKKWKVISADKKSIIKIRIGKNS